MKSSGTGEGWIRKNQLPNRGQLGEPNVGSECVSKRSDILPILLRKLCSRLLVHDDLIVGPECQVRE